MRFDDWCLVIWLIGIPLTFGILIDNVLENAASFFPMLMASVFWPVTALGYIGYLLGGLV